MLKFKHTVNQSRMFAMGKEQGALSDLQLAKNKNNQAVNQS